MEQWTYLVLDVKGLKEHTNIKISKGMLTGVPESKDLQECLQTLGADGWEFVQVFQNMHMSSPHFYFKRRITTGARINETL